MNPGKTNTPPPAHGNADAPDPSRPWPPPMMVVFILVAIAVMAFYNRPAAKEAEPGPRTRPWGENTQTTAGLGDFLDSSDEVAPDFMRGVGLGLFSKELEYDYGGLIGEIAEHDADWISLIFNIYQKDGQSTEMGPLIQIEEQERILRATTRQAHESGIKVLAFPLVLLSDPTSKQWRGNVKPDSLDDWFANYTAHIVRMARVFDETGVEALCVGSEFSSLEQYEDRWRILIARVREVYSGRLIYSANWDHYKRVTFWDELDAIGLSGYYELTRSKTPTLDELIAPWVAARDQIFGWRSSEGLAQPIVFTEIGYANQDGTNIYPWDYTMKNPPDPEEQALCYEAFIRTWHGQPGLGGVFFYNWFGFDTLEDTGYSPRGKPAAQTMKMWYGAVGR